MTFDFEKAQIKKSNIIEHLRNRLHMTVKEKGLNSQETIAISQDLDRALNRLSRQNKE
jgi:hypothetical protein